MVAGISDALGQGALYGSASALGPQVVEARTLPADNSLQIAVLDA